MEYFECSRPTGDGYCSDDECPCREVVIPRGKGYLYIEPQIVAFRRKFPWERNAEAEAGKRLLETSLPLVPALATLRYGPILVCRQGAKLRGINLRVAGADAKRWWKTGQVPFRPTPLANGTKPPVGEDDYLGGGVPSLSQSLDQFEMIYGRDNPEARREAYRMWWRNKKARFQIWWIWRKWRRNLTSLPYDHKRGSIEVINLDDLDSEELELLAAQGIIDLCDACGNKEGISRIESGQLLCDECLKYFSSD